jgi:hypothetical protein
MKEDFHPFLLSLGLIGEEICDTPVLDLTFSMPNDEGSKRSRAGLIPVSPLMLT